MTRAWWCLLAALLLLRSTRALAAPTSDLWLPGSGKVGALIATGVPFLVMSELTLGVTDHAALGVFGGTTPIVSGFGLRPRGAVTFDDRTRLLLSAPVVYYPEQRDGPAWWLIRPAALLSWKPSSAWSLAGGAGAIGVAAHSALFGGDRGDTTSSAYGRQFRNSRSDLWWTLNALASVAISERSELFADATGVFRGYALAGADWVGRPPFILFLGVSTLL